jgi:hypothetical protein
MLNVSQFPVGKTDLEHQTEVLKQIRLDSSKQ